MPLTAAIHQFVAEKLAPLETQLDSIIAAHVVLLNNEAQVDSFTVKVHLAIPGSDLHAQQTEANLYTAIDKVVTKLHRLIRKRKTRLVKSKKNRLQQAAERSKLNG